MALSTIDTSSISGLGYGFKNRIINGGMVIDQRNAGASVTPTTNTYLLDRWNFNPSAASKVSFQRSTTAPAGFTNSLLATSLAATSVASGDYYPLAQGVEGFNVADLGWGTASAQTITLSFWVRSSVTGTHGASVKNLLAGATRSYPFTFTVNSANTYEYKTVTVPGDTSGSWATDNSCGLCLSFSLGMGSTYKGTAGAWASANFLSATGAVDVVATSGATFYITGVQLEKGTVATSFDWRPYGTELVLCQRYYQTTGANGAPTNASGGFIGITYPNNAACYGNSGFKTSMRTTPTVVLYDNTGTSGTVTQNGSANGVAATAANITSYNFSAITKTSGTWYDDARYTIFAGYTASAEL